MNKHNATIWISGVTASGKTTLGKFLLDDLIKYGIKRIKFFDGDILRKRLNQNYGHSLEERYKVLEQYIDIVKKESNKGNIIIVSTVSHKSKMRELARNRLGNFMEINLKCSPQVCLERDFKGVYSKLNINDKECLPGVTEPYEFSELADLILDTENNSIQNSRKILFSKTIEFLNNKIIEK
tara:strand:+ start:238 stop:783 length:546 start_codon:yes stop_codon:yes gene_type:complete